MTLPEAFTVDPETANRGVAGRRTLWGGIIVTSLSLFVILLTITSGTGVVVVQNKAVNSSQLKDPAPDFLRTRALEAKASKSPRARALEEKE